jgi:hypothetical protein
MFSPCNGRPVAQAPPHRDRFKRDKCVDPRTRVSALFGYVEKHDAPRATVGRSPQHPRPRSAEISVWVCREAHMLPVQRSAGGASTPAPRSVQKSMFSPCNGRPVAQAPPYRDRFKKRQVCGSTNSRLTYAPPPPQFFPFGSVVRTCVTTRHHTTLGGERLLSLVWFWLFGVWVVCWMVGRVVVRGLGGLLDGWSGGRYM